MAEEQVRVWRADPRQDVRKALTNGRTAKALLASLGLDPSLTVSLDIRVRVDEPITYKGEFIAAELPETLAPNEPPRAGIPYDAEKVQ